MLSNLRFPRCHRTLFSLPLTAFILSLVIVNTAAAVDLTILEEAKNGRCELLPVSRTVA